MKKKFKVLHVLTESFPRAGGSGVRSKYIVDYQKQYCDPVVVTSPFLYDIEQIRFGKYHVSDGIPYFHSIERKYLISPKLINSPGIGVLVRRLHMHKFERFIDKIVAETRPDIIQAITPFSVGFSAWKVACKWSIPFIYEVRAFCEDRRVEVGDIKKNGIRYKWNKHAEKKLMTVADAVIIISESMKDEIISMGITPQKIFVVPNGVDPYLFKPRGKDERILKELNLKSSVVFGMTSVKPLEGAELAIQALAKIIPQNDNVKILFVCDWMDRKASLESYCRNYGVQDFAIFVDRVNHFEIPRYYSVMDVLLVPRTRTRYHTASPLRPLEAMAMKKVVLGSNVSGLAEIIEHGITGLLFEAGNVEDLASKCNFLCQKKEIRKKIGENARTWVISERTWKKVVGMYEHIYSRIFS